jgi:DnaK suppressor protein
VNKRDLKRFEDRLLEERERLTKELANLREAIRSGTQRDSSGDLSAYSFHMADLGTDAMEREKQFLFASAEGRQLNLVNDALRRLYAGEYGNCEHCGQPIARDRLDAMPYALLCIKCKEAEERQQAR